VERCPHAWTLRYWADGKQRERSFKDAVRNGGTVYGSGRKLAQVAGDRDAVLDLLTETIGDLSICPRRQARMIIEGTLDEAVKAGKIREHRIGGIELADNGTRHDRTDFVFPAHAQVRFPADGDDETRGAGICVWLMRRGQSPFPPLVADGAFWDGQDRGDVAGRQ
jgi:hypothetical protein